MKKTGLFLVVFLLVSLIYGQSESYTKVIQQFETHYNAGEFDTIYDMFSPKMKKTLPQKKTQQFLTGIKMQAGKIKKTNFIKMHCGSYALYKAQFEKAVLGIHMSLNKTGEINGFFVKPYSRETPNTIVNQLTQFPVDISAMIYSETKALPDSTQLSIALIRQGKTEFYGIIKKQDTLRPVNNKNKIFEVGSVTKVFTATVLASLVKDKKLKLTENINPYFPYTFKDHQKITFESLANHTSGLPTIPGNMDLSHPNNPYKNYGHKKLKAYLTQDLSIDQTADKKYAYSNLGMGLLGYSLGLSQHTDFKTLLHQRVLDKYQLKNTFTAPQDLTQRLVKGRDREGQITSNWDFKALFGAGGLRSTTSDLVKFIKAQFRKEDKVLALTRKQTFKISDKMGIGLGWHILKKLAVNNVYWHNGGTGGYSSSVSFDPKTQTGVVILSNVSAFHPNHNNIDQLDFALMKYIQQ